MYVFVKKVRGEGMKKVEERNRGQKGEERGEKHVANRTSRIVVDSDKWRTIMLFEYAQNSRSSRPSALCLVFYDPFLPGCILDVAGSIR